MPKGVYDRKATARYSKMVASATKAQLRTDKRTAATQKQAATRVAYIIAAKKAVAAQKRKDTFVTRHATGIVGRGTSDGKRTLMIQMDVSIADKLQELAAERGTSVEVLIDAGLRNLANASKLYDLADILRFGKYQGMRMEDVIRADPGWTQWAMANTGRIVLSVDARRLMDLITAKTSGENA